MLSFPEPDTNFDNEQIKSNEMEEVNLTDLTLFNKDVTTSYSCGNTRGHGRVRAALLVNFTPTHIHTHTPINVLDDKMKCWKC
jgi:hypothetical protein